jgi:hypothetical protein
MSRIDRTHDGVLQHVLRAGVAIRPGIDQNEDVGFRWDHGSNAGAVNGPTSYVGFRCVVRGRVGDES